MRSYFDEDFDINDVDADLEGFYSYISEMLDVPTLNIINKDRFRQFEHCLSEITKIVKKTSPDAVIEYILNDELNTGTGTIRIETDEFVAGDIKQFISSIQYAANIEFYPLTDNNIRIGIAFNGMMIVIPK